MVISIIIPSFYPAMVYGGTITASLNNARLLVQAGHKVHVSTTNTNKICRLNIPTNKFIEIEKDLFVKYYNETIVDKFSLALIFNIWRDIRKADVVHLQAIFNSPIPFTLLYSRILNVPVLLSPHGVLGNWIMSQGSILKKLWLKIFIKPFSNYVYWHATSNQEKDEILFHFPNAKVLTIPNAVNLEDFSKYNNISKSSFLEKYAGVKEEPEKLIVSMGRLQSKKGFDILIHSFKKIIFKNPNFYLLIAGSDDGEKNKLQSLIKNLGLVNRVFLIGDIQGQTKVDFLANADLFVLPSHNENFGMVYAESLAAGTPIVASTNTPWEEIEEYHCGRWVKNSIDEIADAVLDMLLKNKEVIKINGELLINKFSPKIVSKQFVDAFELTSKKK
jgi:glycosyltransferase involved in cell wall biosynthesis